LFDSIHCELTAAITNDVSLLTARLFCFITVYYQEVISGPVEPIADCSFVIGQHAVGEWLVLRPQPTQAN